MIDFIKVDISPAGQSRLGEIDTLKLKGRYDPKTGEYYDYPLSGWWHNMKITVKTEKRIIMEGSLHQLYNYIFKGKKDNSDTFTWEKVVKTIEIIEDTFKVPSERCRLSSLEFGLNLKTEKNPCDLIENYLSSYNFKYIRRSQRYKDGGVMKEYEFQQYKISVYDKGAQVKSREHILRIELKTNKMIKIKGTGIFTLADLKNINKFILLTEVIKEEIGKLIFIDRDKISSLSNDVMQELLIKKDPMYWEGRRPKPSDYQDKSHDPKYKSASKQFSKEKQEFIETIERNGLNDTQQQIESLAYEEFKAILNKTWDN